MPVLKLILDTRDRVEPSTNDTTLCSWNISDQIRDIRNIKFLSVYAVEFPNSMYNITSRNNTFTWLLNGAPGTPVRTVDLPEGYYSGSTIVTDLALLMNGVEALQGPPTGVTYTVAIDITTKKLSIAPSAGTVQFLYGTSTIGNVLGFRQTSVDAASITSDTLVNLQGVSSVMLRSNIATQGRRAVRYSGVDDVQDFLAYVPISEPFLKMVYWYNNNDKDYITMTNGLSSNVYIRTVNRRNEDISPNFFNYKVILLIDYSE